MLNDPAEHEPESNSEGGIWVFMVFVAVFAFFAIPYMRGNDYAFLNPYSPLQLVFR